MRYFCCCRQEINRTTTTVYAITWKERSQRVRRKIELMRLKRIRKKNTPQYTYCKNCGTRLEGMYCYRCGQYALDTEQPFWKYIRQYFENVYQFDTKIWRTLWYMFSRPGFLTAEFNAGKINSYVHPFRLYMCISVVFFAVFFMLAGERVSDLEVMNDGLLRRSIVEQLKDRPASAYTDSAVPESTDNSSSEGLDGPVSADAVNPALADTTIYLYQTPMLVKTLAMRFGVENADSLVRYQLVDNPYGLACTTLPRLLVDSCFMQTELAAQDWDYIRQVRALKAPNIENWIDGVDYGPDNVAAIRAFHIDSLHLRTAAGEDSLALSPQAVYIWTDRQNTEVDVLQRQQFSNSIMGNLSKWTPFYMMFLLPLFAFLLKLFYRRQHIPYMWHFVHAIHINTVFLILLSIPLIPIFAYGIDDMLAASQTLSKAQENLLTATYIGFPIVMFLYLLVSFRVVYRQGWVKTSVKSILFYAIFTFLALAIAAALLLWLLAAEAGMMDGNIDYSI